MINNLTAVEQLTIIGQVFLKIGWNFLPAILVAVVIGIVCHRQEQAGRGYSKHRR